MSDTTNKHRLTADQSALELLTEKWKQRLRLMDWKVEVRVVRQYQTRPDVNGSCRFTLELKSALISVVDLIDAGPPEDSVVVTDLEQILVHELLHLHFAPWFPVSDDRDRPPHYVAMEQAIEMIAWGLVLADRAEPEKALTASAGQVS